MGANGRTGVRNSRRTKELADGRCGGRIYQQEGPGTKVPADGKAGVYRGRLMDRHADGRAGDERADGRTVRRADGWMDANSCGPIFEQ